MLMINTPVGCSARAIFHRMHAVLPAVILAALFLCSGGRSAAATPIAEILNPSGVTAINVSLLTPLVYTVNGRALNTGQVNIAITKSGELTPSVDTEVDVVAGAWQYRWEYPSAGGTFTIVATPTATGGTADSVTFALNDPIDPNPHESLDLLLNAGAVYANSTAITVQLRIAGGSTAVNTVAWSGDISGAAATAIPPTHYNDNNSGSGLRYQGTASGGDGVKTVIASVEFNWPPPETVAVKRSIILDLTKPTVTTQAATASDFITQPDGPDNAAIVHLSGTVTDAYGPRSVEIQLFTTPGTPVAQPLTPAVIEYGNTFGGTLNWTARINVPDTTTVAHNFRVIAIDYAGNVNEAPTYYAIPIYSELALGKPFIVGKEGVSDSPVPVYVTGTQTVRSQITNPAKYKNNSAKFYVNSSDENADKVDIGGVSYLVRNDKNFNSLSGEKALHFSAKVNGTNATVTSENLNVFTGGIGVSSLLIDNIVTKTGVKYIAGTALIQANCSTKYFESYIQSLNLRDDLDGTVTTTAITGSVSYTLDGEALSLSLNWDTTAVEPGVHKLRITGTDIDGNAITQSNEYTVYVANATLTLEDITLTGNVSSSTPPRVKDTITVKSRVTEAGGNDFLIPIIINAKQLLGTEAAVAPEATLANAGGVYSLTYNWDTTDAADNTTYTLQYKLVDIFSTALYSNSTAVIVDNTSTALTITTGDIDGLNPTSGVYRNYPGDVNSIYVKGQIRIPGVGTNYDMLKNELISTPPAPDVYDRIISFVTDPAVDPSTYTVGKTVAANTADITVDWDTTLITDGGGNPVLDGEYEVWLSATDINDATVPCNHVLLTIDNNPPVITVNDPSGALPQIKFDPPNGDNKLAVKAKIDDENPLDWTVDIAYYVTGDVNLKHDIYIWSERSKDNQGNRTNSDNITLTNAEASVGNAAVVWTIPDEWNTGTNGTILVTAVDKAQNAAPDPAVPQVTFTFAVPGDTTVAPIAALAVHLPAGAGASARLVTVKKNGQAATYETIEDPQTAGMAASSGDPSDGFSRPNAYYPVTAYNNPLTKELAYQPLRVYTNNSFVVDAAARVSPKDTLTLMMQYPAYYSLTISNRVYDFTLGRGIPKNVAFIPKSLGDTVWNQEITQELAVEEIDGVESPTLYSLTNIATKDYYGSNQASLEVLVDTTNPVFKVLSPSSVYYTAAYTDDAHTASLPKAPTQRYIVVPPGGTIPLVFTVNKNVIDDDLRTPLKRMEVDTLGSVTYKQMPALTMTLNDGSTGNVIKYNGIDVEFSLVKAVENPNPYNGNGRALVTGNSVDQAGYTVAWNIPIDKKFAVGKIYRLRLSGMKDIVANPAMAKVMVSAVERTVDAVDIYFKVSLWR